jgi:hypothetical protein
MAGGNGPRPYKIICSEAIREAIQRVHRRASRQDRGQLVTDALREIIRDLELAPFKVGEPAYRLPAMRMQVRTTVVRPLVVHFGVCEDRPLVFLKRVKLLSKG